MKKGRKKGKCKFYFAKQIGKSVDVISYFFKREIEGDRDWTTGLKMVCVDNLYKDFQRAKTDESRRDTEERESFPVM